MNRLDRTMGILLLLRGGKVVSAAELARRFEVSVRTIYRDLDMLSGLGIPVAPEMGRGGGFLLKEGYFLPPVTLGPEEAISLIVGLKLMRSLRIMPFPAEADFAERKLLAVLPEDTRRLMAGLSRYIGFEGVPPDLLHPEPDDPSLSDANRASMAPDEGAIVGAFLRAVLSRSRVLMRYSSPWRGEMDCREIEAYGLIWDRDRWYLAGREADGREADGREADGREADGGLAGPAEARLWRSDRVLSLEPGRGMHPTKTDFDVASLLGRRWLAKAMEGWRRDSPARIAMRPEQADLLRKDWYYGHALFEDSSRDGSPSVTMTYGEDDAEAAARLVLWLGPGAEILEPPAWRETLRQRLLSLLAAHAEAPTDKNSYK